MHITIGMADHSAGKSASTEPKNVRKTRITFGIMNKDKAGALQSFMIYRFGGKAQPCCLVEVVDNRHRNIIKPEYIRGNKQTRSDRKNTRRGKSASTELKNVRKTRITFGIMNIEK